MSDDNNVIEFERRAAQVKAMHAGYLVKELDGATLKAIFDAAFMECRIDSDGECIVNDDVTLIASADLYLTASKRDDHSVGDNS